MKKYAPVFKILVLHHVCNLVAILHGFGYLALSRQQSNPQTINFVFWWAVGTCLVVWAVVPPLMFVIARPIARVLVAAGTSDVDLLSAQRRAFVFPFYGLAISALAWLIPAASFPVWQWFRGVDDHETALRVVTEVVVVGTIGCTFAFYAVEYGVQRWFLPRLLPLKDLASLGRVPHLPVGGKITLLVFSAAATPIAALTALKLDAWATTETFIYFGVSFVILGLLQGYVISRSVVHPLSVVSASMRRVQLNELKISLPVASVDHLGRLSEGFNAMVDGLSRAEKIKNTFGVYVHPKFVDELLDGNVALSGELRQATVLFADVRGFTTLSEKLPPQEVVKFLNRYLDLMVEAISTNGGTVDKFIGDGIMAGFGVPLEQGDDAMHAVRAALDMLKALDAWNVERAKVGEAPVAIGIGLHTGPVIAGSIGSKKKMQYTLIGDTVNTAARIEEQTKATRTRLLISKDTFAQVSGRVVARELEPRELKGKSEKTVVYEVSALSE